MADKLKVVITDNQKVVKVQTGIRMLLRRCCHAILENDNYEGSAEIGIIFTDNAQMRELCRQHFGCETEKDYIALSSEKSDSAIQGEAEPAVSYLGDVCISFERAVEAAAKSNRPIGRQMVTLTAMGVLELLGYTPEKSDDDDELRQRVELVLFQLGFPVSSSYYISK